MLKVFEFLQTLQDTAQHIVFPVGLAAPRGLKLE